MVSQRRERAKLDKVDARQLLAEGCLVEQVSGQVGKIIRRRWRKITVLLKELMGMKIDRRIRHRPDALWQLGDIARLAVEKHGLIEFGIEAKLGSKSHGSDLNE